MNQQSVIGHAVQFFPRINGSVALKLAIDGWVEMNNKGLGDGSINWSPEMSGIVGFTANGRDQLPVGVLTFDQQPGNANLWVSQAYVQEEFRGRGVYSAMWAKLVEFAAENGYQAIRMGTHLRNSAMRAVAQRTGCIEEAVVLKFSLE